ncbi:hypothetical protein WLF18_02140 [Pseudomonas shirazensis]|uniref:Uncharacterized protein n=1 Tax=Pseudomonas shirazensis TaxID=2745494 RepID=A0ABU8ZUB3_9PSED
MHIVRFFPIGNADTCLSELAKAHIGPAGAPYVMAICGERDSWMRGGWQERGIVEGVIAHGHE